MTRAVAIPDDPAKALAAADDPRQFVLVALDRAKAWLTTAGSVTDVNDVRAKAEAIRVYTVQAKLGKESEQAACELRLRAERRVGQLLKERPAPQGRPPKKTASPATISRRGPSNDALGLTEHESSEFQKLADIPEKRFDEVVSKQRAKQSLSRAALLNEGQAARDQREHEEALAAHGLKPLDPSKDAAEIARLRDAGRDLGQLLTTNQALLDLADRISGKEFAARYGADVVMPQLVEDAARVLSWLTDLLEAWKERAA